jgi:hypothetical protein
LQNLNRFSDAVDVFGRCALAIGNLTDRCKASVDEAKRQAAQPK